MDEKDLTYDDGIAERPAEPAPAAEPEAVQPQDMPAVPASDEADSELKPLSAAEMPAKRQPAAGAPRQRYVRPARPHKTQPTISDAQHTKYPSDYTHDSGISIGGGGPLSGASYRRSRSEMKRLQRDLHYGQYLEIPKGRRSIFASQERARRTKSVIALAVVVAILAVAAIMVWQLMVSRFGL